MRQKETREAIKALVETSYETITRLRNETDAAMEAIERLRERLVTTKAELDRLQQQPDNKNKLRWLTVLAEITAQSCAALPTGRRPAVMALPRGPHDAPCAVWSTSPRSESGCGN